MKIVAIIPSRMGSSRFPGKPLVSIAGLPMIEHVRRRALLCKNLNDVVVATCDSEIFEAVQKHGGKAVMTAPTHERCTDRVEEAARNIEGDVFITVQGDEPLLQPSWIEAIAKPFFDDSTLGCTNLLSELESEEDLVNPNIVKAACDQRGRILFFSRSVHLSYPKRAQCPLFRQTGIQAFRKETLRQFTRLTPTPFEKVESVDMFRLIEHGFPILGVVMNAPTFGVDRVEHVKQIESILKNDPIQKKIFEKIRSC